MELDFEKEPIDNVWNVQSRGNTDQKGR